MPVNLKPFGQFACRVCGDDAAFSFDVPTAHLDTMNAPAHFQAWCQKCCPGHDYDYDRYTRGHACRYRDGEPPDDFYDSIGCYEP